MNARKAMTLVEIVIVVVIIGVIASILIPAMLRDVKESRGVMVYLDSMRGIIAKHHEKTGAYPQTTEELAELLVSSMGNVPALPMGKHEGCAAIHVVDGDPEVDESVEAGWVYSRTTGKIIPNTERLNADGILRMEPPANP